MEQSIEIMKNRIVNIFLIITLQNLYSAGWLLDIARYIYTLKTDKIISKIKAGKWALDNNLIPDVDIMGKVIKIREEPNRYKNNNEVMKRLGTLGSYVQINHPHKIQD